MRDVISPQPSPRSGLRSSLIPTTAPQSQPELTNTPPTSALPACAGNRAFWPACSPPTRVHPRVRGEQYGGTHRGISPRGPSPRARGAANAVRDSPCDRGAIPACAGSRTLRPPRWRGSGGHPRVRGEQRPPRRSGSRADGPSPRARGAVTMSTYRPSTVGGHPRVRGEQGSAFFFLLRFGGPSPRARGAEDGRRRPPDPHGAIPACAGSRLFDLATYQRQAAVSPTSRETDKTDTPHPLIQPPPTLSNLEPRADPFTVLISEQRPLLVHREHLEKPGEFPKPNSSPTPHLGRE